MLFTLKRRTWRAILALAACTTASCSEPGPWSDEPGIELCKDAVFECENHPNYSYSQSLCVTELFEMSGLEEKAECSLPEDPHILLSSAVSTARSRDELSQCAAVLHGRHCWR